MPHARPLAATACLLLFTGSTLSLAQATAPTAPPAPAVASPAPGTLVLVSVKTGEAFLGTLVSADSNSVIIDHPTLGRLAMPRSQVVSIAQPSRQGAAPAGQASTSAPSSSAPPASAASAPAAGSSAPTSAPVATETKSAEPKLPPEGTGFFHAWKGSVELGLSGASGNSENFALHTGLDLKRETVAMVTSLAFEYNYGSADGDKNTDRGSLQVRNDWKIDDSRWSVFAQGRAEYDAFQDWDWRLSTAAGLGYQLIKTDKTSLVLRGGFGVSKEFGSSDNRITPEALAGADFELKINETQKFTFGIDSYWSVLNLPKWRVDAKAGYEILVDPKNHLSLKLGVEDRFEHVPGDDKKHNDIFYFAALVYSF